MTRAAVASHPFELEFDEKCQQMVERSELLQARLFWQKPALYPFPNEISWLRKQSEQPSCDLITIVLSSCCCLSIDGSDFNIFNWRYFLLLFLPTLFVEKCICDMLVKSYVFSLSFVGGRNQGNDAELISFLWILFTGVATVEHMSLKSQRRNAYVLQMTMIGNIYFLLEALFRACLPAYLSHDG